MTIIDDSKVQETLRNLERNLTSTQTKRAYVRASRKGGNYLKDKIRSMIPESDKFPLVKYVRRAVIVKAAKTFMKHPGVNITIKKQDLPVSPGKGRDFWDVRGYAYLVFFGTYMNKNLHGRPGGSGERKGVKGIVQNNVFRAVEEKNGTKAIEITMGHLVVEVEKEISKSAVR